MSSYSAAKWQQIGPAGLQMPAPKNLALPTVLIHVAAGLMVASVFLFSIWQGSFAVDGHHWGLMLSNAQDLCRGRLPYKEIFIQYGILTTLIHALAFCNLGETLLSVTIITSAAYATAHGLLYLLALRTTERPWLALLVVGLSATLHPAIESPWSNYIAYPFLVGGLLLLIHPPDRIWFQLAGGLLLGLTILAREGLAPAMVMLIVGIFVLGIMRPQGDRIRHLRALGASFAGLLLPATVFFAYLAWAGVLGYWYQAGVELPRLYAIESMPHMSGAGFFKPLFWWLREGLLHWQPRRLFFALVLVASGIAGLAWILTGTRFGATRALAIVALAAGLMLSASFHLPEVFRLASGTAVGIVVLAAILGRLKLGWLLLAAFVPVFLVGNGFYVSHYYYLPDWKTRTKAERVIEPAIFRGQHWTVDRQQYYHAISMLFKDLYTRPQCRLRYHYNMTTDAFLTVLSPFTPAQWAPWGMGPQKESRHGRPPRLDLLRPDLALSAGLQRDGGLLVMKQVLPTEPSVAPAPGYQLLGRWAMPYVRYIADAGDLLELWAPARCLVTNGGSYAAAGG